VGTLAIRVQTPLKIRGKWLGKIRARHAADPRAAR
jgi:hypothetical protein